MGLVETPTCRRSTAKTWNFLCNDVDWSWSHKYRNHFSPQTLWLLWKENTIAHLWVTYWDACVIPGNFYFTFVVLVRIMLSPYKPDISFQFFPFKLLYRSISRSSRLVLNLNLSNFPWIVSHKFSFSQIRIRF